MTNAWFALVAAIAVFIIAGASLRPDSAKFWGVILFQAGLLGLVAFWWRRWISQKALLVTAGVLGAASLLTFISPFRVHGLAWTASFILLLIGSKPTESEAGVREPRRPLPNAGGLPVRLDLPIEERPTSPGSPATH